MDITSPDHITVGEAAARAGCDRQTVYRWLREAKLTRYKTGRGRTLISVAELDDLLTPRPAAVASPHH
jgi:excisionase family DNA binding protein